MQRTKIAKMHTFVKAAFIVVLFACVFSGFFCVNLMAAQPLEQDEVETITASVTEEIEELEEIEETTVISDNATWQNNDDLFEEYVNTVVFSMQGDSDIIAQSEMAKECALQSEKASARGAGSVSQMFLSASSSKDIWALNELQKPIYDAVCAFAKKVADGDISDTTFTVSFEAVEEETDNLVYVKVPQTIFYFKDLGVQGVEEAKALVSSEYIDFKSIYDILLYNNPSLFYWHDKVKGSNYSMSIYKTDSRIRLKEIRISFSVSEDYSDGTLVGERYLFTNQEKTSAAKSALDEAQRVVSESAGLDDYEKLCAYRDYICKAVSYNYSASYGGSYGDPWQFIYVFDQDESTNVVCEGYAKAFKYLCDLSEFKSNIKCSLVGGYMSSGSTVLGGHMWNILSMDDGKNYLVDLTNADAGSSSADCLFLDGYVEVGQTDNPPAGCSNTYYIYRARYSNITFYPFSKMEGYYANTGIVNLAKNDYELNHIHNYIDGYCEACDSYENEILASLAGCSLAIKDKVVLNAYMYDDGRWSGDKDNYVSFEFEDGSSSVVPVSGGHSELQKGRKYLVFSCELEAYQMTDYVSIKLCKKDGSYFVYSQGVNRGKPVTFEVSVIDYSKRLLNAGKDEDTSDCMKTVLLYGGAIQKYRNYKTERLASAGISPTTAHIKKLSDRDMMSLADQKAVLTSYADSKPFSYKNLEMSFDNGAQLRVYISASSKTNTEEYSYFVNGKAVSLSKDSKGYYIPVDGNIPTNFAKQSVVTIKKNSDGSKVLEVSAGAYNWVKLALTNETKSVALKEISRYVYYLGRYGK